MADLKQLVMMKLQAWGPGFYNKMVLKITYMMYFKPSAWNVCLHEMKFIHEYNKRPGIFLEVNKT